MSDFDLDRFLIAQNLMFATAMAEIQAGRKEHHWMWFIFPQLRGLGRSDRAQHFGIAGLDEARAYLAHPVLGKRLVGIARAMLAHRGRDAAGILGEVDAKKLRSSATLFAAVPGADPVFQELLDTFYDGSPCPLTAAALAGDAQEG